MRGGIMFEVNKIEYFQRNKKTREEKEKEKFQFNKFQMEVRKGLRYIFIYSYRCCKKKKKLINIVIF